MTLLVGIADKRKVWIGADSASVSENFAVAVPEAKVFKKDGWLIAGAGDWRALEIVRYYVRLPNVPTQTELHRSLCIGFSAAIEKGFSDNNYKPEDETDFTLLVGVGNSLFHWSSSHAEQHSFTAVGIGEEFAIGYLEAKHGTRTPSEVIRETMKATRKYYGGSIRPPYRIEST